MRRSDEETEDQLLFDLPLDRPAAATVQTETRRTPAPRATTVPPLDSVLR